MELISPFSVNKRDRSSNLSVMRSAMLSRVSGEAKFISSRRSHSPFLTALTREPSTKSKTKASSSDEE